MEDVEVLELLTGGGVHDGLAGDLADGQCGTTAGVAVQLGEDHAGEVDAVAEGLGSLDGILADHRVDDEENFIGVDGIADIAGLGHQGLVDAEAAGGIDNDDVVLGALGFLDTLLGHPYRVAVRGAHLVLVGVQGGARVRREDLHAGALADDLQLLHRTRALQVTGHQHWGVSLGGKVLGQLAGQGGLTRTLEAGEHDDRRRVLGQVQAAGFTTEDLNELLVDNLDHLLGGVQGLGHLGAGGALLDALDKAAHDVERHVRFEQRQANLTRGGVDVCLGQLALAAQA